ncbi:MAG: urea transporter [Lamprobacter sp.]|uniref:urea transporter n=1 Tax=Lamprobacter sp. TaxID=3100796 RepID=UPI002B25B7DD|nr:urea transporter [Lamprobacter sp.]MEA3639696.1 urea transporter [Lamprobacter sp.]
MNEPDPVQPGPMHPDPVQQANAWEIACCSASPLRFIDFNLRGIGQVMFQDNPLSGLFFFAAIGWGSFIAGALEIAIGGLLALLVASLTALWLRVETAALHAGLYGFNAYLLGIALATFLDPSPLLWVYVVLGGAVSVIATLAATRVMQTWGLSALTAPFILITWLLLLSSNGFSSVPGGALPTSGLIQPIAAEAADPLRILDFLQGILISISQVFVKGDGIAALLILIGLAVGSIAAAGYALAAALISVVVAHLLGAESQLITGGLVGFNPILTAIAVGTVFARPGLRSGLYALLATIVTVLVQGAMVAAVTPFAIPTLTASFVLVTWLFLLAKPAS